MSTTVDQDLRADILAAVTDIINGAAGEQVGPGALDQALRSALVTTGFHLLGVPENAGGSGGSLGDAAVVVELLARRATHVPFGEEAFVAGWLLAAAELSVPDGPTVAALGELTGDRIDGRLHVSGTIDVPWGRHAEHIVLLVQDGSRGARVALVAGAAAAVDTAENLAGEPRDMMTFIEVEVPNGSHAPVAGIDAAALLRRAALLRSVQLAGAARAVLDHTLSYVVQREQFGRPLAKFQAVQQQLAALAGEVTAMQVAAFAAVLATEAAEADTSLAPQAKFAVAAAKATTSASAHLVAGIGHQLHGALGYSQEHPLGAATTRLWSWRDECGNESLWHSRIAAMTTARTTWWSSIAGNSDVSLRRA